MQTELPLIGLLRSPEQIRDDVLRTFGDEEEVATKFAVRWAWDNRRIKAMSQHSAAQHVGMPASHFSCVLNGQKYLPPHKINSFEWVVGNHAVAQTIARFAAIRENEQAKQIGLLVAETLVKAA
jgi:hypothetical protein